MKLYVIMFGITWTETCTIETLRACRHFPAVKSVDHVTESVVPGPTASVSH